MEKPRGKVKHLLLAKFKPEVTEQEIQNLIQDYAGLVDQIESMKSFRWGLDVSVENLNQGYTHIFVSGFESTQGIADYLADPAHVNFANIFLPKLAQVLVVDFEPKAVPQPSIAFSCQ